MNGLNFFERRVFLFSIPKGDVGHHTGADSAFLPANRRCGRVICALCSPHRITIPRPFVVRPPIPEAAFAPGQYARQNGERDMFLEDARQLNGVGNNGTDLPMASSMPSHAAVTWPRETASTMIFSAEGLLVGPDLLDGGEEVRICNPCVPDPNNEPPPQQQLQLLQHQRLQQEINRNHRPRGSPQGRQRDIFVAERGDPDAGVAVESFSRSSHLRNLMRTRRSTVGGPQFSGGGGLESESESGRPGEGEEEEVGRSTSRYDDVSERRLVFSSCVRPLLRNVSDSLEPRTSD